MIRAIMSVLFSGWFLSLIGAIVLSLLVWFVGPLIAIAEARPLDADWVRMVVILVILVVWGLWNLFALMRRRKRETALEEGLAEAGTAPGRGGGAARAGEEEVRLLSERLDEALEVLRRSGGGRKRRAQYLYELPWYILIGPPGSGKTTALVNSGLRFPLGDDRNASVRGVAGTRNCDWWFADEAILLDTAGRYTTQDSDPGTDAGAWKGFLALLRKARPRQPINGAFVAISIADIIAMDEGERQRHAQAVRARLSELQSELGVRFPVYLMLTKADLLSGFIEFFDDLGREERAQVWGMTFPFDDGRDKEGAVARFEPEFDALIERLTDRALERVHQEVDQDRRGAIFGFPTQVAALKVPLARFLDDIFRPSRLEQRFLLRGVYFTSGTQEGRPIDRVMAAMGRAFGLAAAPRAEGRGGRAYFLQDLLKKGAFAEAGLVNTNPRAERRERLVRAGAIAAALLVLIGGGVAWAVSYFGNQELIAETESQIESYRSTAATLTPEAVNRPDPAVAVPALNLLRDLPAGYAEGQDPPLSLTFGLYQGDRLGAQGIAAYRRALEQYLLPPLVVRMEEMLSARLDRPEFLFEALKVYLMLGGEGPLDADLVRTLMVFDWEQQLYPGPGSAQLRADLAGHLDALMAEGTLAYPLDGGLIRRAREVLMRRPAAERAYAMIRGSAEARALPDWVLTDQVGRAASKVFVRASGRPLDVPISGLLTKRGFYEVFLPKVGSVIEQVNRDAWVLGTAEKMDIAAQQQLTRNLMQLYYRDYEQAWRDLLQDLQFRRPPSLPEMADLVNDLASPTSPASDLLKLASAETRLTEPPSATAAGAADTAARVASQASTAMPSRLGQVLRAEIGGRVQRPGQPVEDAFRDLHRFMDGGGIDGYLATLERLFKRLETAAARGEGLSPDLVNVDGGGLPSPVAEWTRGLSGGVKTIAVGSAREQFAGAWNGQVADACRDVVGGRYPFARGASAEVPLADFARLFGPGGLLERFYRENMAGMVDTSGKPWKWREGGPSELGLPAGMPEQFRRAEAIRTAFFGLGGTTPRVTFSLTPVSLDPSAEQVTLSVDGTELSYAHGPVRSLDLSWPGTGGVRQARLSFRPPASNGQGSVTLNGPWAWFRLLDAAKVESAGAADKLKVTFSIGERQAVWSLRAHSVENPFALPELRSFSCPPRL